MLKLLFYKDMPPLKMLDYESMIEFIVSLYIYLQTIKVTAVPVF